MKTRVKFLANERGNPDFGPDIFAFFPDEPYNELVYGDTILTSYSRIGQHSACHIDYANESREATLEEYISLKEELESIGYKLNVINT